MNNRQGFTLIEMLVVVAIIGLLSSVVVVGLSGARQKARDAKRVADIQQMMNAAEVQFSNAGYPTSINIPNAPQSGEVYYYGTDDARTYASALACMETLDNASTTKAAECSSISALNAVSCPSSRQYFLCKSTKQ